MVVTARMMEKGLKTSSSAIIPRNGIRPMQFRSVQKIIFRTTKAMIAVITEPIIPSAKTKLALMSRFFIFTFGLAVARSTFAAGLSGSVSKESSSYSTPLIYFYYITPTINAYVFLNELSFNCL